MIGEDLAKRSVAAWRKCGLDWIPGMRVLNAPRFGGEWRYIAGRPMNDGWLPDLDDPATIGCIEHSMLKAVYGVCGISVEHRAGCHRVTAEGFDAFGNPYEAWSSGWLHGVLPAEGLVLCLEHAAEQRTSC